MMWEMHWDIGKDLLSFNYGGVRSDDDQPSAWHLALLRTYNDVDAWMFNREILPGEVGVIYRRDETQVLWAFEDLVLPLTADSVIRDVTAGTEQTGRRFEAKQRHVYTVNPVRPS